MPALQGRFHASTPDTAVGCAASGRGRDPPLCARDGRPRGAGQGENARLLGIAFSLHVRRLRRVSGVRQGAGQVSAHLPLSGYAPIERGFDGKRAWEESPDYGIEALSGTRLSEVRRQAVFHLALDIKSVYAKFSVTGRDRIDGNEAVVVQAVTLDGTSDTLWFGVASGLLLGIESTETFANGVAQRTLPFRRLQAGRWRPGGSRRTLRKPAAYLGAEAAGRS